MSTSTCEKLPLGAVRTAEGEVVVPASRRADGSTRKPIRIRQGYVPQDEVPKYRTVAQRRREQAAKRAATDAVDELPLEKLSLREKSTSRERPPSSGQQERQRKSPAPAREEKQDSVEAEDKQQQLKRQLTKRNKLLKDIGKLEAVAEPDTLTPAQQQKLARKSALQQERQAIIAEMNGATVTSSTGASGVTGRTKVAISL